MPGANSRLFTDGKATFCLNHCSLVFDTYSPVHPRMVTLNFSESLEILQAVYLLVDFFFKLEYGMRLRHCCIKKQRHGHLTRMHLTRC